MTSQPFVSVIIPHFSDLQALDLCLSTLMSQSYPPERVEVIVADNASPMGEAAVAAVIGGRAKLLVVKERGAGPARNGGVSAAKGEVLAFIDSDCLAHPDWLTEGVRGLATYDFVGGSVDVAVEDPQAMTPVEAFECVFAFDNRAYVEKKGFTVTANLFCSRAVFDAVGGFRNGVSEDVDWSLRAGQAGFRIGFAAAAIVKHPARRSWADLIKKWRRINAETFALTATSSWGRVRWLLRTAALPLSAIAHTPKVLCDPRLASWRDRTGGLAVLYRHRLWRVGDALRLLAGRPAA